MKQVVQQEMSDRIKREHGRKHMKAQPEARIEPHDPKPRTGDSQVMERIAGTSPQHLARIAGVIYLLFFFTVILGEFFMEQAGGGLRVASGDAAVTATNIL